MSGMIRATPANKCPICDGDTWCVMGHTIVICMRVASDRPHTFKGGETGYKHLHPDPKKKQVYTTRKGYTPPVINAKRVLVDWHRAYERHQQRLPILASSLGVTIDSLNALECQACGGFEKAWGFPMKDGYGNYIGIRLRNEYGKKWAVTGSQSGLFIPNVRQQHRMFIVEGPTNTAAALSMGLYVIGRPSCSGGVSHIQDFIRRNGFITEVVIIGDNDRDKLDPNRPGEYKVNPGVSGAVSLQKWIKVPNCIVMLPCNDLREFHQIGDRATLDSLVSQMTWTQPSKENE